MSFDNVAVPLNEEKKRGRETNMGKKFSIIFSFSHHHNVFFFNLFENNSAFFVLACMFKWIKEFNLVNVDIVVAVAVIVIV